MFSRPKPKANQSSVLHQELPPSPSPDCCSCNTAMPTVKPLHSQSLTHTVIAVTCLAVCPRCNEKHIGTRSIRVKHGRTAFVSQQFEVYSEVTHGEKLKAMLGAMQAKPDQLASIQARPVTPHPDTVVGDGC